ncbi:MAG: hypothetical protein JXB85_03525 [Anaerolineales bacterium]|nr:hypothetical protein [Anaerolineales bacterium]
MLPLLLATKFHIPPLRPDLIHRPRLVTQLQNGQKRKVTLVSAPAGFGKTTAIVEWIATGGSGPVAWLSLDRGDNDPPRFWTYFIAALQIVRPGLGQVTVEMLASLQPTPLEAGLTALINDVAALPEPLALVLDDYHLVETQTIHESLAFLVEHQPAQLHLVVAGRADPPWPLARMRSRGEVLELRERDLRFTPQEAADFLTCSMKLGLEAADMAALKEHTEGWVAGLQMAAISLQDRQDTHHFVADFTASNRYIFDYLIEEVLRKQAPEMQDFLLATSILERLSAPLCDAVMKRSDSQAVLDYLERGNLFLIPLDDKRHWYRYHHLFADLLRLRLQQVWPEHADLHQRAAEWLEANGLIADAIGHSLGAEDYARAARIAERNVLALVGQGHLGTLASWLESLPDELTRSSPWLGIAQGYINVYAGNLEAVDRWLVRAEAAAGSGGLTVAEAQRIAGHVAAIRSFGGGLRAQEETALVEARRAIDLLPEDDWMARCLALTMLAIETRREGRLAEAAESFARAVAIGETAGNNHVAMLARSNLTSLMMQMGRLSEAEAVYQDMVRTESSAGRRAGMAGMAWIALARIARERNDLEAALEYARQGLEISRQWGQKEFELTGYIDIADVLVARGEFAAAREQMALAKRSRGELSWPPWLTALEAEMALQAGDLEMALGWAEEAGLSIEDEIRFRQLDVYLTLARLLLAQERWSEAQLLLQRLHDLVAGSGAVTRMIVIESLRAVALYQDGQVAPALEAFQEALSLGEAEGFTRSILEAGPAVADLLRRALGRGIARDYAARLLAALHSESQPAVQDGGAGLVEPLSGRELEVLRMLESSLDMNEIARQLYIAVSTVRTHAKKIYAKLGVNRRMEAIHRARELGLL